MKKILILGSNSFAGSNFISFILKKNFLVYGISRSNELNKELLVYKNKKNFNKNFKFYKLDINKNLNKIIDIIYKNKINFIINYSAQGMVNQSWKKPIDWYNTNVISQIKLVEKLKNFSFIQKYINFSTPEVYGNNNTLIKENYNFYPSTPYANSRATFDFHLLNMKKQYNFPVIITRASNIYGPYQQLYRVIPKSILSFQFNRIFKLDGGGKSVRNFIYIDDVSRATYLILNSGKIGETYHISNKDFISIKDLVRQISNLMNVEFKSLVKNNIERKGKDHAYKLNASKLKKQLNWESKVDLEDGLLKTINWIKVNSNSFMHSDWEYKHKK